MEREALWRQVVVAKYGTWEGGWCSNMPTGTHGVGLWKFIRFGWDKFSRMLRFEVGDGTRVRFWDDVWCTDGSLKEAYPELFRIAKDKAAYLADNFQRQGDSIHWEVTFSRLAQDWKMESFLSFLKILYSVTITGLGEDKVCWQPSKAHIFQVKSYYDTLTCKGEGWFPWKSIWKAKVPPRVAFFTWTAALGKILTAENLRRRHITLVSWCYMCKANGESVDHLLLHYVYAKELWDLVLAVFGMCWVMPCSVRELFATWQGKMGKHPKHMI